MDNKPLQNAITLQRLLRYHNQGSLSSLDLRGLDDLPLVSRFWIAHRWGKPNLKRKQMHPLRDKPWRHGFGDNLFDDSLWRISLRHVIEAEADPSFAEWITGRGGRMPEEHALLRYAHDRGIAAPLATA
jgi:hypothetical protein